MEFITTPLLLKHNLVGSLPSKALQAVNSKLGKVFAFQRLIGSGDKVRFWEDVWVGNLNLKTLFLRLFSLSLNQGQKVEEVGVWVDLEWRWTLTWRRNKFE